MVVDTAKLRFSPASYIVFIAASATVIVTLFLPDRGGLLKHLGVPIGVLLALKPIAGKQHWPMDPILAVGTAATYVLSKTVSPYLAPTIYLEAATAFLLTIYWCTGKTQVRNL